MMAEQIKIDFNKPLAPSIHSGQASPVHGDQLLDEERRIMALIRAGRSNARQAREISELTGLRDVEVRALIAHLINIHKVLIVSATSKPAGYYFPVNEDESDAGAEQLVHRIRALAIRLKNVKRQTYEKIFGQTNYLDELDKKAS